MPMLSFRRNEKDPRWPMSCLPGVLVLMPVTHRLCAYSPTLGIRLSTMRLPRPLLLDGAYTTFRSLSSGQKPMSDPPLVEISMKPQNGLTQNRNIPFRHKSQERTCLDGAIRQSIPVSCLDIGRANFARRPVSLAHPREFYLRATNGEQRGEDEALGPVFPLDIVGIAEITLDHHFPFPSSRSRNHGRPESSAR